MFNNLSQVYIFSLSVECIHFSPLETVWMKLSEVSSAHWRPLPADADINHRVGEKFGAITVCVDAYTGKISKI